MGNVRIRKETGNLYLDFTYEGLRCREQTSLKDTPTNRKKVEALLNRVEAMILLDNFEYTSISYEVSDLKSSTSSFVCL